MSLLEFRFSLDNDSVPDFTAIILNLAIKSTVVGWCDTHGAKYILHHIMVSCKKSFVWRWMNQKLCTPILKSLRGSYWRLWRKLLQFYSLMWPSNWPIKLIVSNVRRKCSGDISGDVEREKIADRFRSNSGKLTNLWRGKWIYLLCLRYIGHVTCTFH